MTTPTEVFFYTSSHGLTSYSDAIEAWERVRSGVCTGADQRLVRELLDMLFRRDDSGHSAPRRSRRPPR